jgi:hypothetical protein
MGDIKIAYGSETSITITLDSLADGGDVTATAVDNSSNLFPDALIQLILDGSNASQDELVEVYIKPSPDNSDFDAGAAPEENATLIGTIKMDGTNTVKKSFFVSRAGMPLPKYWQLHVVNQSGYALNSSGNSATYTGVYYTY